MVHKAVSVPRNGGMHESNYQFSTAPVMSTTEKFFLTSGCQTARGSSVAIRPKGRTNEKTDCVKVIQENEIRYATSAVLMARKWISIDNPRHHKYFPQDQVKQFKQQKQAKEQKQVDKLQDQMDTDQDDEDIESLQKEIAARERLIRKRKKIDIEPMLLDLTSDEIDDAVEVPLPSNLIQVQSEPVPIDLDE